MIARCSRPPGSLLSPLRRRRLGVAVLLVPLLGLVACNATVAPDLVRTPTAAPIRASVTAATPPRDPTAGAALATGQAALAKPDPRAAIAAFDQVLSIDPDNVEALVGRAVARGMAGDLDGAAADLDAAIARAPDRSDLLLARAELALTRPDIATALAAYDRVIARDPGHVAAYIGRAHARLLIAQGDPNLYQQALADLNRALALAPDSRPARLGRADVALDRFAFRGDPADLDRAVADLDALPADSADQAASFLRVEVLAARGDPTAAQDALAAITAVAPAETARQHLAEAAVARAAREWDDMAAAATAALAADPAAWEAYRRLAWAELGRGQPAAALAASERLLAHWPDDGPALYLRGVALRRLGRGAAAEAALDAAARRLVDSPVYQARIAQERATGA